MKPTNGRMKTIMNSHKQMIHSHTQNNIQKIISRKHNKNTTVAMKSNSQVPKKILIERQVNSNREKTQKIAQLNKKTKIRLRIREKFHRVSLDNLSLNQRCSRIIK